MCTRCRRDKKVPKVQFWSEENNMDLMSVSEELSVMSDAEQIMMLIAIDRRPLCMCIC